MAHSTSPSKINLMAKIRNVALVVHRYGGLLMATFLFVAGLTGSLLAFLVRVLMFHLF